MQRERGLADERERAQRVRDVQTLQVTHTLLLYYILHAYTYYMLQILTEKGEQRLEEERRKRDREECERVEEELQRAHKEVEHFCTSKSSPLVLAKQVLLY
jgi:hypothetical protein